MEATYLSSAAEVYAKLGDFKKAYRNQLLLRDAEQRNVTAVRE